MAHIPNYRGAEVDLISEGYNQWIKVYNDTTAALTNGEIVKIEFFKDADGTDFYPTVATPATSSVAWLYGVVENSRFGKETIADTEWGWVQIRGLCPKVTVTTAGNAVAVDDFLNATNSTKLATCVTSTLDAKTFAIAKSTKTVDVAGSVVAVLFGREVTV